MNYETQQFVPCDACGEEFPQHMVSNRYGNDLTCDCCTEQIARDFEQSHDSRAKFEVDGYTQYTDYHKSPTMTDAELDDWAGQY